MKEGPGRRRVRKGCQYCYPGFGLSNTKGSRLTWDTEGMW